MSKKQTRSAADSARVQAVQNLRRGSAASPVRSKKIYRRVDAKRFAQSA